MPAVTTPLIEELKAEAATTKRMLERVPGDKLAWRPAPKSMTLGQLALHVATIPGAISGLATRDGFDASEAKFEPPQPTASGDVLKALEEAISGAESYLSGLDGPSLGETWSLTNRGQPVFAIPRAAMLRTLLFNHWYHHRGQLSVYLRLLGVPLPTVYGPTADENPFGN